MGDNLLKDIEYRSSDCVGAENSGKLTTDEVFAQHSIL
jgi:hypothetical protein